MVVGHGSDAGLVLLPPAPLRLSAAQLQAAKWCAFALMVGAHASEYVFRAPGSFLVGAGQVCFPIFAWCFAQAVDDDARAWRACKRLALLAVLAQLPSVWLRGEFQLNVLFSFCAASALMLLHKVPVRGRSALAFVCIVVGLLTEFSIAGLAAIAFAMAYQRSGRATQLAGAVIAWAAYCAALGEWWGLAAVAVVPLFSTVARSATLLRPRWWENFGVLYAAHFVVLAGVRELLRVL